VTASTFTPEQVSDLTHKGNDYAAKTWLAVWIESDDPKPKRDNPKKIKEFMRKKYEEKTWYWDPFYCRSSEPPMISSEQPMISSELPMISSELPMISSEPPMISLEPPHDSIPPSIPPSGSSGSPSIKSTSGSPVKLKMDNSWADFALAFPTSNKSSLSKDQQVILIPNSIKIKQDLQLDPFESVKSVYSFGKYDALKDLAGLSLSETAPKSYTSLKKVENKTLDLSKFVEVGTNSINSGEKASLPGEGKSLFSQFEMNPFAIDEKVCESENEKPKESDSIENSLEYNEWNAPSKSALEDKTMNHLYTNWVDHDPNPTESTPNDMHVHDTKWNDPNPEFESSKDKSHLDSQWHNTSEIDSSYNFQNTSTTTLYEGVKLNDGTKESEKYPLEANSTLSYAPYELDLNVWG
jgi:hypothetical protein